MIEAKARRDGSPARYALAKAVMARVIAAAAANIDKMAVIAFICAFLQSFRVAC
jgi:hypothetical protein